MSSADRIARANPIVHGVQEDGTPHGWALMPEALRLIESRVRPGMRTAETGAGHSTILFASLRTRHTCICPAPDQVGWIKESCAELSIDTGSVEFVIERSEDALPSLDLAGLELALIDGNHAFPTAFIDFYYFARALQAGGRLVIDDVQLWPPRTLRNFLRSEPGWRLDSELPSRTTIFEKTDATFDIRDWTYQPYVARRSFPPPTTRAGRRFRASQDSELGARMTRAVGMALDGDFAGLLSEFRSRLSGGNQGR